MKTVRIKKATWSIFPLYFFLMSFMLVAITPTKILADGDEVLGAPSVPIASGSGIEIAGTGLFSQPATLNIIIDHAPAINQVLLYWYGRGIVDGTLTGDDTIVVDGIPITGTLIGETLGLPGPPSQVYRADITGLGLLAHGNNSLTVSGQDVNFQKGGAGVLAIVDDGSGTSDIQIRDGHDFAVYPWSGVLGVTVPQTFAFDPADAPRTAALDLFIADGEAVRPDAVEITIGSVTTRFENVVVESDGAEWDTLNFPVDIPAGETTLTVQVISFDDGGPTSPDSICWIAAVLTVPLPYEVLACRVTGGGADEFGRWSGKYAKGKYENQDGVNRYTFGGQVGAPTVFQPQPYGEWTHHQKNGPDGGFTFHAGTSSAPKGTEIDVVQCSDPGWCVQARLAPAKQIDFEGIGTFKNIKLPSPPLSNVVPHETFHWFQVHIEDLGEPGKKDEDLPPQECPPEGSSGDLADCDCPDFYHIVIYQGFYPQNELPNMNDVIYEVYGYVNGGNLQIHPPIESSAHSLVK